MFGGAHELKGNGSFGRKKATKTVACSESPYTITDVHECRLAENGGARLATTVPRLLDSGWDKSIEYYIKKNSLMISAGISNILSNNGTLTWSEKVEFAIGLLLAYSVGRRSCGSRRIECRGLDETAKWIKLYQAISSKKGSMASSTALESAYLSHSRSMKMDGVRVQDVLKEYNGPRYEINTRLTTSRGKSSKGCRTFNWQTAIYGKVKYYEDEDDCFTNFEFEFPAIVFDDTSDAALSCEPTVSPLNDDKIDFRISFDESDDEDYTVIYDENSFSYKIIFVNNLKTDSENDNDKVNMPFFTSPEPTVSCINDFDFFKDFENEFPAIVYNDALTSKSDFSTKPGVSPQHIDLKEETSLSECDEEEQNVLCFNDLFSFNVIYPDELKSDTDKDNDKIDIERSSGDILAENGGARLATTVPRLLDSGWDKSIEYYIKKNSLMISAGISTILSNNGTLTWSEKVEFAIGLLLAYSVGRRSWGSRRVECRGLDETAKWIKLYQALSSKKGSMASSTALESAYLSHSRSMKMDGVRVQDVLKEYNGPRYEINTRLIVNMDDPNITMEEYTRLEEKRARRRGKVYNWETDTYGKIWYDEDVHDLRSVETEFPSYIFNDAITSEVTPSYEPTVCPLNDNEIDFRISFDESDDEDYTDNDNDKIDIEQPSGDMSVIPSLSVINVDTQSYLNNGMLLKNFTVYTTYSLNEYSVYKSQYDVSWGMDMAYRLLEPSERNDNVGRVFINLEISKCWSLEILRRLFNTLFAHELNLENHS
ncbi:hypothetical protein Tco_1209199 [Tanacetum coccineum]